MKKTILLKSMLLLCALIVGSSSLWAVSAGDTFARISAIGDLADGDEIIFVNQAETYACGTTQNSNNRSAVAITVSDHSYTYASKDNVQVFVVKINASGKYGFHTGSGYIYSASSGSNYLRTNAEEASTDPSGTYAWTLAISDYVVSATNVTNTSYYLAFNGTLFSQYKSGQSKPLIFKKQAGVTTLSVKTAPTKTRYEVGENLDMTGFSLDADGNTVTSGYTMTMDDAAIANGATLSSVGKKTITVSYGGKTVNQNISVGAVQSIAVTTAPTKTNYDTGDSFDPTGMVVTDSLSTEEVSDPDTWMKPVTGYTVDPEDNLAPANTSVTITYATKSTTQAITVTNVAVTGVSLKHPQLLLRGRLKH